MERYEKFLSKYSKLGKKVTDLSRIEKLLKAVGNPQDELKFVHIAGTNGKGSIAEMLSKALIASGYKTATFTSPYIIRYNDRIRINGVEISSEKLNEITEKIEPLVEEIGEEFSQFEITQAIAFLYFASEKCDIVVLETGLGGKLDSTNVISAPLAAVISSISYDHTAILGDTLKEIAEQKAGIIKRSSNVILSCDNSEEVIEEVKSRAEIEGCNFEMPDISDLTVKECGIFGNKFSYCGAEYETKMGGYHQIINALTVIAAAQKLTGFNISQDALREGLQVQVPARTEIMSNAPLVVLDGGHNPAGLKRLAGVMDTIEGKKTVIIGMLRDKDSLNAIKEIAAHADRFICVDGFYQSAREADELAKILRSMGAKAESAQGDIYKTVKSVFEETGKEEMLVICGSLYLASKFAGRKELFKRG